MSCISNKNFQNTKPAGLPATTSHLRRLESGLVVPATAGTRTFVSTRDMFPGYFDEEFVSYGTNVPAEAMPETKVDLYEMTADGNFETLLGSFKEEDVHVLFWENQDQILTWVENHPTHLHPQGCWATFFPFLVSGKPFVARVDRYERKLKAYVYHFGRGIVWYVGLRRRLVLPQRAV